MVCSALPRQSSEAQPKDALQDTRSDRCRLHRSADDNRVRQLRETNVMKASNVFPYNWRRLLRVFALVPPIAFLLLVSASAQKKNSCVDCHSQIEGTLSEPVRLL